MTPRRSRASGAALVGLFLVLVCLFFSQLAQAASRYDPRLRFRTLSTRHFDVHFHQGEEQIARRLAAIAEEVAAEIARGLGRPRSRVHVVLVDQTDVSNGWAIPTPYNLMEITAAPPRPSSTIGNTDDWLRLVFTHEYTHIVHLDRSAGWIGGLRRVFGAHPALFPNLFLPQWQVEGVATYTESAVTGQGRVWAGDFRLMLDRAAASGRLEPLDRASGGLVDWPSGNVSYLYGAYFNQYLADRYGEEALGRLADVTAGRVPYFGSGGFRKVYGRPLGDLWKDFQASARPNADGPASRARRLTRDGFSVRAPTFGADGRLFYAVTTPHGFPSLMERPTSGGEAREIANGYGTLQLSSTEGMLLFDRLELVQHVGLQSDLYALDLARGSVRRLTSGARAAEPDGSPDGKRIVCVVQRADRRELAILAVSPGAEPVSLLSEPFTEYSAPRWSPDGRAVVAERRRLGGPSEIVIVDVETKVETTLVTTPSGRNVQPAWWSHDRILFASDRGAGFEVHAVAIGSGLVRRLLDAGAGALSPVVSRDGRTIVFVGYTADGYDLFSLDLEEARWSEPVQPLSRAGAPGSVPTRELLEHSGPPSGPAPDAPPAYTPWATLTPRLWSPTLSSDSGEIVTGGMTHGGDALGRHGYGAAAEWSFSRARPDWQIQYTYDRWRPTLFAGASDDTDPWRAGEARSQEFYAGALLPVRRVRWVQGTLAALNATTDRFECASCPPGARARADRRSLRLGAAFSSARTFGYSVSPEEGLSISVTTDLVRRGLGADGDATAWTADVRGYLRVLPRHGVIAARVAGAASSGDPRVQQVFSASGSGPREPGFGFGRDAVGLLRGFEEDATAGTRAAMVNLDYRVPLASVQRGLGTLPVFLRTIHAAVFADAGDAWTGRFDASRVRASIGAELSSDVVLGHLFPLTLVSGVAWRHDPSGAHRGAAAFGRVGWAF